jgi:hypothetical protein
LKIQLEEQIDFAADIIDKFKLIYAEDAVHEEAFEDMARIKLQNFQRR